MLAFILGEDSNPELTLQCDQFLLWTDLYAAWPQDTVCRKRLRNVWRANSLRLMVAGNPWSIASGPMQASILTLLDNGWAPALPGAWLSPCRSMQTVLGETHAPTQMMRITPEKEIQALLDDAPAQNASFLRSVGPSKDPSPDAAVWTKTEQEFELDMLMGPWYSIEEIPFPVYRLARRFGTWEQHGEATEPSARPIDDLKEGRQNEAAGLQYTH